MQENKITSYTSTPLFFGAASLRKAQMTYSYAPLTFRSTPFQNFDVLLTVHLSIISATNQLNAQNLLS